MRFLNKIKRHFPKGNAPVSRPGQTTSPTISSSVAVQLEPEQAPSLLEAATPPPPPKPEPVALSILQEKIWENAYEGSRSKEPNLVEAFEKIVLSECHYKDEETRVKPTDRIEAKMTADLKVTSCQMRKVAEGGIERTKKQAALKQGVDDGLRAVQAVVGIMDRALRAAPEAAVIWATVCLGIEALKNPITEALENRQGIQYVLGRTEWYWNLTSLLLDENKGHTTTVVLRDTLEKNITKLFEKLLLYQIRSICLYHRSQAATFVRDMFLIDDWAGQLNDIKATENTVLHDMEQYNTQEIQTQIHRLNNTASDLQVSLGNIYAAIQSQAEQQEKRHHDDKDNECLRDLYTTDPRTDKKNIQDKKGGLLRDSYKWILEHNDFQKFKNNPESRILWIKGDAGKGKTMLLCGIIDELELDPLTSPYYFFCQATGGNRLSSATSVLRGLIYHLAHCNPQLTKHVRKKYDSVGKKLFENESAWFEVRAIAAEMLKDPSLDNAILVVDALDECTVDRKHLLDFITESSTTRWIVSSRNWPDIEESLNDAKQKVKIHLEINQDSVSAAVDSYIKFKVDQVAQKRKYDDETKTAVLDHLQSNARGTFLWVALVCQELSNEKTRKRHTLTKLKSFPPGLDALYKQMLQQISESEDAQLCKDVIAKVLVVYRPVTLEELHVLVEGLTSVGMEEVEEVIKSCGSFLTLNDNTVSFIHQSAKDYFLDQALDQVLPCGIAQQHQMVLVRSLDLLCKTLERDIYHLKAPGSLIDEVSPPDPDPLAAIRYSCTFWVDHLHDSPVNVRASENDKILAFFTKKYLQWLEALSLLRSVYTGVRAIGKLESCLQQNASKHLQEIVKDAYRFLLSNAGVIEIAPLQVYKSALIFSPSNSLIKQIFSHEEPDWMKVKPRVEENWDACLQTLEGHGSSVDSVAFSNDGQLLASGSFDKTVKIWDATSGMCVQTLEGHHREVTSVVFSNDGQRLASASWDKTVKIWDATSGVCVQTLEGHHREVTSVVFSNDGRRLASGSFDKTVKIWDATSGVCVQTLEGHHREVTSVVFSNDGQRLASASWDKTVKIWDATSGVCVQTLEGHHRVVESVVFSNDGQRLASGSDDNTAKIWDATSGVCLQTLEGHGDYVTSAVFTNDEQRLASGSFDKTVKIWDATSGMCVQTLEGHHQEVTSVVFSNDGRRLASGSEDNTIKIWDETSSACMQTLEGHHQEVRSVVFSNDRQRLASVSGDSAIKIWDVTSGACVQTLEGHEKYVTSVVFSNDAQRLASASRGGTVKIWDATSGAYVQTLEGHGHIVTSVVFSNDGQRLASGSWDKTVKIWDATSGACVQTLEGHEKYVTSVVFSNDGQRLASGSRDNTVKIWDATSGACMQTLEGHERCVTSVVFSNDGQRLASGSWDNTVKIWDATSGVCVQALEGHGRIVTSVVFSNDGQRLASGAGDNIVNIWDATSGACLKTLEGHGECVASEVFTNDEQRIASGLLASQSSLPHSRSHTYSLSNDDVWIMEDGQRMLWLPPSCRPWKFAIAHTRLALGSISGRIITMEFRSGD
ncbi:Vegetative incompatibility protein HET-E-1 [Ceratocystis lukuohia]|uniref:Vegetative incompatibility protein HET-E-1 n=1 Tax=Ceratocystis lukuohia TaxID=2019550 RepID=A0ABR4MRB5_9PEZI